jgi:hypothetical protein
MDSVTGAHKKRAIAAFYSGVAGATWVTIFRSISSIRSCFPFHSRSSAVLLAVELFFALYIASFAWFWQLCRSSARRELTQVPKDERPSNLIPFERGLQMHLRKNPTAI